ncbi:MAG: hypothetical protein IIY81_06265 [Lachnospiraceae bacterium]|nr:hypothetical protein [Lachnospiraceae bacterium]
MEKGKEKVVAKVCPICSNTEIALVQKPLEQSPTPAPKFVPMGCVGKVCKFYNEQMNECIFVIQTVFISNIANKIFEKDIAEKNVISRGN